jgi:hypothetical protein
MSAPSGPFVVGGSGQGEGGMHATSCSIFSMLLPSRGLRPVHEGSHQTAYGMLDAVAIVDDPGSSQQRVLLLVMLCQIGPSNALPVRSQHTCPTQMTMLALPVGHGFLLTCVSLPSFSYISMASRYRAVASAGDCSSSTLAPLAKASAAAGQHSTDTW